MSTDIIEQAKRHNWWYSDTNVANLLIHEIERLRGLLREIADYSGDSGVVERVREVLDHE